MDAVSNFASGQDGVVVSRVYNNLCSSDGLEAIKRDIETGKVDRVLIAGCSPKRYDDLFRNAFGKSGLNRGFYLRRNIREQCAWVHKDKTLATEKAKLLVKSGLSELTLREPVQELKTKMTRTCLVIGGGVAGMSAAIDLANNGFYTYLVERDEKLGGRTFKVSMTHPTLECGICCIHDCRDCVLTPKLGEIYCNENIDVMLSSEIVDVTGYVGEYSVSIKKENGDLRTINVGTVIIATGYKPFDPNKIPEYSYDHKNVITSLELENLFLEQKPVRAGVRRPSDGKVPDTVSFIQCVGSRDINKGNPWCSLVCCNYAIGQAKTLKKLHPETDITIHYIDIRASYRGFEEFYNEVLEMGVKFLRGRVAEVQKLNDNLQIVCEDTISGDPAETEADMVVLSIGMEPNEDTKRLADLFHRELSDDGFYRDLNLNLNLSPEARTGVFLAGCAQGPKSIRYSIADGKISAGLAADMMRKGYILAEDTLGIVDEDLCGRCRVCVSLCPYDAIKLEYIDQGKAIAKIDPAGCTGCGVCGAACPTGAISMSQFKDDLIFAQIDALLEDV
ncbi:MAG: CoB--CoM heterodisulfide reductase iron-sulfur subunit A family protein [Halobacteriota archaeon]|nr:CoB--CoM heterodisulfide reductase iron-sulfur subunit A family protein [Halobacteriota archaeon]